MTERLLGAAPLELEPTQADPALRPLSLAEFLGQEHLVDNLQLFIEAARARGEAMDHVLLYGPPGLGKTTLAHIISRELGVNFKATSGPVISKAGDLAAILTNLEARDVLFIDEIHRLNPVVEEILYPAMEDHKLDLMIGEGPSARSIQIDLPPFTLIGATTRSGLVTRPLRERFGIPLRLKFYEPEALQVIVLRAAGKLGFDLTPEGAFEIAQRSRGTPRIAGRLLRRVRDITTLTHKGPVDRAQAADALARLEVDHRGCDSLDHRYLGCIIDHYDGGPVGAQTLSAALSEQIDVIEEVIEPYLIQQGFIQRTPRGRCATQHAYAHLGKSYPLQKQPIFDFAPESDSTDD